jgi:predicted ATPase
VLTGGPGGGKTTAADLFRREIGEAVVAVPEAATMLFTGGFPRPDVPLAVVAAQRAIFHVQRNLEDLQAARYPGRILLCDRGTVDGAAYWPESGGAFFDAVGTTHEEELRRYYAVVFFESAAVGGFDQRSGNPIRNESLNEAARLDARLREVWAKHPRFVFVGHRASFFDKLTAGLHALREITTALLEGSDHNGGPS